MNLSWSTTLAIMGLLFVAPSSWAAPIPLAQSPAHPTIDSPDSSSELLNVVASSPPSPQAEPQREDNFVVINPHITSPKEDSHWPKGTKQIVKWDTSKIPEGRSDATGLILLGYTTDDDEYNEHLKTESPLASGFRLADGQVEVVVPEDVANRPDYFIVLFGNSGNTSPKFSIEQPYGDPGLEVEVIDTAVA